MILRDQRGWYVMERRPGSRRHAAGKLTCFGGSREPGECPEACARRELMEEIGFAVGTLERCVVLSTPRGEAWFYRAIGPEPGTVYAKEADTEVEWIAPEDIFAADLSAWHAAALRAELDRVAAAMVP